MNISEKGVTFGVTLTYRSRKSLMQKDGTPERTRTSDLVFRKLKYYFEFARPNNLQISRNQLQTVTIS